MKMKVALLLVLFSIGLHSYLSLHYYDLNFNPASTDSVCNIGDKFNCDSVAVSQFSNIMDIPIALFGAVTNAILAILLGLLLLGWVKDESLHSRFVLWLSGFVAAVSVVMGFISLSMSNYCLFCILAYILSFATFALVRLSLPNDPNGFYTSLRNFIKGPSATLLLYPLSIPLIVAFIHFSYLKSSNLSEIQSRIQNAVEIWKSSSSVDLTTVQPSFTKGSSSSKLVISEFADFRCGHCKNASVKLKAFLGTRTDVAFHYYSFPLDGTCNDAMGTSGDGISCFLAKTVYCAEKLNQKGLAVHDYFYSTQELVNRQNSVEGVKELTKDTLFHLMGNLEPIYSCVADAETDKAIRAQALLGQTAGVKGTPSLYLNGKKIALGSSIVPMLEAAYKSLE